jgi:hypothetical protein
VRVGAGGRGRAARTPTGRARALESGPPSSPPPPSLTPNTSRTPPAPGANLGLSVEPERHFRLTRLFPEGLHDPWRFSPARGPRPGPGDFAAALAAASSLLATAAAAAEPAAEAGAPPGALLEALAASYDPQRLSYSPYSQLVLDALASGVDPAALARQADDFLNLSTSRTARTSSDRAERQPFGAGDAGGALRAAAMAPALAGVRDEVRGAAACGGSGGPSGRRCRHLAGVQKALSWPLTSHPSATAPGAVGRHRLVDALHPPRPARPRRR